VSELFLIECLNCSAAFRGGTFNAQARRHLKLNFLNLNSVQLVSLAGTPISDRISGLELDPSTLLGGELKKLLHIDGTVRFSPVCLISSFGKQFRLHFHLSLASPSALGFGNAGQVSEDLYSDPFTVSANSGEATPKTPPTVTGVIPDSGYASQTTEVWIKGSNFGKRVSVRFGDCAATILEREHNLISCLAPARPDFTNTDIPRVRVPVQVENSRRDRKGGNTRRLDFYFSYLTSLPPP